MTPPAILVAGLLLLLAPGLPAGDESWLAAPPPGTPDEELARFVAGEVARIEARWPGEAPTRVEARRLELVLALDRARAAKAPVGLTARWAAALDRLEAEECDARDPTQRAAAVELPPARAAEARRLLARRHALEARLAGLRAAAAEMVATAPAGGPLAPARRAEDALAVEVETELAGLPPLDPFSPLPPCRWR